MTGPFDDYVLKARVAPLALVALPPATVLAALAANGEPLAGWGGLGFLAVALLAVTDMVRLHGRKLETRRWRRAGSPTAQALAELSPVGEDRRRRIHAWFGIAVDPEDRDSVERAAEALRQKARSGPTPIRSVAVANANYGRLRHLVVLRPVGLVTSLATLIGCGLRVAGTGGVVETVLGTMPRAHAAVCATAGVAAALIWVAFVTASSLDEVDRLYTTRLMGYLDSLPPTPTAHASPR